MLTSIRFEKFKCFDDYTVPLKQTSIIVGKNNAGKSTIVEGIKLISLLASNIDNHYFKDLPTWLEEYTYGKGFRPSIRGAAINLESAIHHYGRTPAKISATFDSGEKVVVYVDPSRIQQDIFYQIIDSDGKVIRSRSELRNLAISPVTVLPTVAPLQRDEKRISPEYVKESLFSRLTPLHFRNQLILYPKAYKIFKQLAEETWPGIRVYAFDYDGYGSNTSIALQIQDNDFVAEVGSMGHGLQMWLQIMWFLSLVKSDSTLVFDEPDIYLHADLQRKLIRTLYNRNYHQTIIATHSIEIMSEVDSDHVVVIDRSKKEANFIRSQPALQRVIDNIGGVHNLQLARLWSARRCLLLEGKDLDFLKVIQDTLFSNTAEPLDILPNMTIGGWGGWNYAIGSSMVLKNAADESIMVYCILDKDYHTESEIKERYNKANNVGMQLHIWGKKEIENYLLVPPAILRTIIKAGEWKDMDPPGIDDVVLALESICQELYQETLEIVASELQQRKDVRGNVKKLMEEARKVVNPKWDRLSSRLSIVSGKEVLSKLRQWTQNEFGCSFTNKSLAAELRPEEIDSEVIMVIEAIEKMQSFINESVV